MHQKKATGTADSSRNTQRDGQHFCTKKTPNLGSLSSLHMHVQSGGSIPPNTKGKRQVWLSISWQQQPDSLLLHVHTNVSHEKINPRNPWTAGKENITGWSDVCLSVLKQPPAAKSDLPCSSQKKVIWTLKMVAGLFLPSNNHSSSCHCSENLLF